MAIERFRDRTDAGRRLAQALEEYAGAETVVLGLPRGGVPVAFEVAAALGAPLDVWVVRKVGVPWQPELGMGAVSEGGYVYRNTDVLRSAGISAADFEAAAGQKIREVEARVAMFRDGRPGPSLQGKTVILVDDGIATGGTARVALDAIRAQGPRSLILAVPTASPGALESLEPLVDRVVCIGAWAMLSAVGQAYENFDQVPDEEVLRLLRVARESRAGQMVDPPVRIRTSDAILEGDLTLGPGARGLVLFAHGSGSSRLSPRNRFVAQTLNQRGLGTLLMDLLTPEEEELDAIDRHLRFDIPLLAERMVGAIDWVREQEWARGLDIGLFGASTGAAAALIAAAERPNDVGSVVSRGGRPDLAGDALGRVRAPTLMIVGGNDPTVLELNREAAAQMTAPKELAIVPGATHLFEEPGTLEDVAELAGSWFVKCLGGEAT